MNATDWSDNAIPHFCWDRAWTVADIRTRLAEARGTEYDRLLAWLLRECSFRDVWRFVTPEQVAEALPRITRQLGRWREFWPYILGAWRELGRI